MKFYLVSRQDVDMRNARFSKKALDINNYGYPPYQLEYKMEPNKNVPPSTEEFQQFQKDLDAQLNARRITGYVHLVGV